MSKLVSVETNYGTIIMVSELNKLIVERVRDNASFCKYIKEIWIFGSTLEERCSKDSDLDICVVYDYPYSETRFLRLKSMSKFINSLNLVTALSEDFIDVDIIYTKNLIFDSSISMVYLDVVKCNICLYKRRSF